MRLYIPLIALAALSGAASAQTDTDVVTAPDAVSSEDLPIIPASRAVTPESGQLPSQQGVQWKSLLNQSFRFLLFEQGFRYATEAETRDPNLPYFHGYVNAVGNLHGWADGDPFYVNYVGHPMQGAVSGYIFIHNDPRYQYVEFGRNRDYWKSRLRAAAWAWAYSEWTEIGPFISEASIGNIQAFHPQQGFVDHVATPLIGLGWLIAEDAMDRYLVRFVEAKTQNRYVRILVRGVANPSRTFANALSFQLPWARPRDEGFTTIAARPDTPSHKVEATQRPLGVAPFDFAANAYALVAPGSTCVGGGADAAFRISSEWQAVMEVKGCTMTGLEKNLSGDSLTYMAGPRWTPLVSGRLVPYVEVLVGGDKLSQELIFPDKEAIIDQMPASTFRKDAPGYAHGLYTQQFEVNGVAIAAGTGLDLNFNRALALRLGLEYTHSWTGELNGFGPNGLQTRIGVVLHMGTW